MELPLDARKFKPIKKSVEEYDEDLMELLEEIERYCIRHFEFKRPQIIDSLKQYLIEKGHLTPKQYNILLEIYYRNNMHKMPDW